MHVLTSGGAPMAVDSGRRPWEPGLPAICREPAAKSAHSVTPETSHPQGLLPLRARSSASRPPTGYAQHQQQILYPCQTCLCQEELSSGTDIGPHHLRSFIGRIQMADAADQLVARQADAGESLRDRAADQFGHVRSLSRAVAQYAVEPAQ